MLNPHRGETGNLICLIFWLHVYFLKAAAGSCHSCELMPVQLWKFQFEKEQMQSSFFFLKVS